MELNLQTYETYLLLYIDNELSMEKRLQVENFIAAHPTLQKEFNTVLSLVQTAPAIQYEDKYLLYKYDDLEAQLDPSFKKQLYKKQKAAILSIGFQNPLIKYSSIAALFLIIIGIGYQLNNGLIFPNSTIAEINYVKINSPSNNKESVSVAQKPISILKNKTAQFTAQNRTLIKNSNPITTNPIISTPVIIGDPIISNPIINASTKEVTINKPIITDAISYQIANETINESIASKDITIHYQEINTEDNERFIYVGNMEIDGDKLRGISRKFNALFKRNKTDKNE